HIERFSPAIRQLSDMVEAPRRITCVRKAPWTGRSRDVDVVLDLMIHDIDHALTLASSPVKDVSAEGRIGRSGLVDEAEAWLTFDNGAAATLSASRVAKNAERRVSVTEPDRVLVADLAVPSLTVSSRAKAAEGQVVPLAANDNLGDQIAAFIASVSRGAPVRVDGLAGLAALGIAARIQATLSEPSTHLPETADL
ncbi:MAG: Gfo/Idh/MocA family protein, partial [Alphaproteobacteria bacterium]